MRHADRDGEEKWRGGEAQLRLGHRVQSPIPSRLPLPESPVIGNGSYRIRILFSVSKRPLAK